MPIWRFFRTASPRAEKEQNALPEQAALQRISEWLTDREGTPRRWNGLEMLQLALHYYDAPEFSTAVRGYASRHAVAGGSLSMSLSLAVDRLNSSLPQLLLPLNRDSRRIEKIRRFNRLQIETLAAIAAGFEHTWIGGRRDDRDAIATLDSLEALHRIGKAANSSLDFSETCSFTAEAIVNVMDLDECSIWVLDEDTNRLILRTTTGLNADLIGHAAMQLGEGISGAAAEMGRSIAVRDAWADPRFKVMPALDEKNYRSMLAVPIIQSSPRRLQGVLTVRSLQYRDFRTEEIEFVETVAEQLGLALWNAILHQQTDDQLRRRNAELTTLQRIGQNLTSRLKYTDVLATIAEQAAAISRADKAGIFQFDESNSRLTIVAAHKLSPAYRDLTLRLGDGVAGRVAASRAPIIVDDALDEPRLRVSSDLIRQEGYRSMICVPMMFRGAVIGVISVYSAKTAAFVEDEVRIIASFADQAAIAIANARLYDQSQRGLRRNELLLRELHHRVKNNLQTVASLLNLQSRRTRSEEASSILALSAGRIAGMAAVHDLLSVPGQDSPTAIEIVEKMAEIASSDAAAAGTVVDIAVDGDKVEIAEDQATVFALVINELIWNAMGHGFEGRSNGQIRVRISHGDGTIRTRVHDNGRGLPGSFEISRDGGLGLAIVSQLVEFDLGGQFSIRNADGCEATVIFQIAPPEDDDLNAREAANNPTVSING